MDDQHQEPATATLPLRQWLRIISAAMSINTIRTVLAEDGHMTLGGEEGLLEAIDSLASQITTLQEGSHE